MFNKDLGTIRLIVGNRGPRISVGTYVTFSNMDKLIVREYTVTHGTYDDGWWANERNGEEESFLSQYIWSALRNPLQQHAVYASFFMRYKQVED